MYYLVLVCVVVCLCILLFGILSVSVMHVSARMHMLGCGVIMAERRLLE